MSSTSSQRAEPQQAKAQPAPMPPGDMQTGAPPPLPAGMSSTPTQRAELQQAKVQAASTPPGDMRTGAPPPGAVIPAQAAQPERRPISVPPMPHAAPSGQQTRSEPADTALPIREATAAAAAPLTMQAIETPSRQQPPFKASFTPPPAALEAARGFHDSQPTDAARPVLPVISAAPDPLSATRDAAKPLHPAPPAPPRLHIGVVEVRTVAPSPLVAPPPRPRAAPRTVATRPALGRPFGWRAGFNPG
jgi:hypothetical protein